jgi:LCP family protein required for cell wall assembly
MAVPHPTLAALPTSDEQTDSPDVMAPAPKRRWYRRKRWMISLVALLIVVSVAGVYAWKIDQAFRTVNEVSTPPPEVSGSSLDGDESAWIDTGPARAAIATYEAEDGNEVALAPTPTPTATVETPASDAVATTPTTTPAGNTSDEAPLDAPTREPDSEQDAAPETPSPTTEPMTGQGAAAETPSPTVAASTEAVTILLMGVDARKGEAIDVGVRPDSLAVLRLDPDTRTCRMLQIPRDTRVDLPGYGLSKINHALAVGGIPYEMQVVEQYLGIDIDHYGLVDFGGVVTVIDEIGGVAVDNPRAFEAEGIAFPAGPQTLNGEAALTYSRFRSDEQGDFGRMSRQQEVLRAILSKVSPGDVPGMLPDMLPLLEDHVRTDMDATALANLARSYAWCTEDVLETSTLEGSVATYPDPLLDMPLSYVIIDDDTRDRARDWLTGA